MSLTIAFTGHRPKSFGTYDEKSPTIIWVKKALVKVIDRAIVKYSADHFISGGAIGVDQWAAAIVIALRENIYNHIKLSIYKPFRSQHINWPEKSQKYFLSICELANEVKELQVDPYASWKMDYRNKCMCKDSDMIIAVWNGSDGGTGNCVKYAKHIKKPILHINPSDKSIKWINELNLEQNNE